MPTQIMRASTSAQPSPRPNWRATKLPPAPHSTMDATRSRSPALRRRMEGDLAVVGTRAMLLVLACPGRRSATLREPAGGAEA